MQAQDATHQCIDLNGRPTIMHHELPMTSSQLICRICLEPCQPAYHCRCRGSLLTHQPCLLQYLNQKRKKNIQNLIMDLPACEICSQPYVLRFGRRCIPNTASCNEKIRKDKRQCACYFLFVSVAIIYFIFMSTVLKLVKSGLAIMLIVVGALMAICLSIAVCSWIYHYLFDSKSHEIIAVEEMLESRKKQVNSMQDGTQQTLQNVFVQPGPLFPRRKSRATVCPM